MKSKKQHLNIIASEAVGIGHPDKICDQISDKILQTCLDQDQDSKVGCEVFACNHTIVIGGEITTKAKYDPIKCVWDVLLPLGYKKSDFDVVSKINKTSVEISQHHKTKKSGAGAGDIGIVYGYATNETKEYLPLPYILATRFLYEINTQTKLGKLPGANYDSKCQISVLYDQNHQPVRIDNVIISLQHKKDANLKKLFDKITNSILIPIAQEYGMNTDFKIIFNNGGTFVLGGPYADTGLTGRKLMTDTYGTIGRHGGGAFSGKSYLMIDRTSAYFARFLAKNIVAHKLAQRVEIQLTYNIGSEMPVSMYIDCFNTNSKPIEKIYEWVNNKFDFRLSSIIKLFNLKNIDYTAISVYGHFTNLRGKYPWEKIVK